MKDPCIFLSIISLGMVAAECPVGWFHYGGSCFWFSHEQLSWYDAQSSCHAHNAWLAEVRQQSVNDFLVYTASTYGRDYWLGGRDDIYEGHWNWSTDSHSFTFSYWYPGEPNNLNGEEDCLEISVPKGYHWNDNNCHKMKYFICESRYTMNGVHPTSWIPIG